MHTSDTRVTCYLRAAPFEYYCNIGVMYEIHVCRRKKNKRQPDIICIVLLYAPDAVVVYSSWFIKIDLRAIIIIVVIITQLARTIL